MATNRLMNGLVDRWIRSGSKAQKLIKIIGIKNEALRIEGRLKKKALELLAHK